LPDKAIDLVDEAASRLRLQLESKPEEIEVIDRSVITMKIEIEALKKEKDDASKERMKKLEKKLEERQKKSEELTKQWLTEKEVIEKEQRAQEDLEAAKRALDQAQRAGNWERAGQLRYSDIPALEKLLNEFVIILFLFRGYKRCSSNACLGY
jgi:ATP-dependent Clp protease ATP-binding subunit ClpB